MLINTNKIGTINISVDTIKSIVSRFTKHNVSNDLIDIDIKKSESEVFYFYFQYSKNFPNPLIDNVSSLSKLITKFIFNNFGIQHSVIVIKTGL